jgi:hypothetical protein
MFRLPLSGVGVLGLLLLACGGSNNPSNSGGTGGGGAAGTTGTSGASGTTSGVAASTKLSAATAADLITLCNATKSDLTGLAASLCVVDGLGENTQAACETKRSACVADPTKTPTFDCAKPQMGAFMGCDVTVGDFESCLSQLVSYFKVLTCADVGMTPPSPPACYSDLTSKCKSIFGSTSTTSGTAGTGH